MIQNVNIDFSDRKELEKYSSAFTLSDMEIFIFPELFYPLVLANIMSPEIWKWREDPWFRDIEKKNFTGKANRIKQYIIQNYVFNLDLSTWGLTTKKKEIDRFSDFLDLDMLRKSNALFGYEGDKYYFDIDIRKHFGLDKYNTEIIPYWKTETAEAMAAFRHKENFSTGAGECVSLSALYAAAMFIIGRIPLEKIFLIATPLHSQNFIMEKEGLITNNRRIVTKNMWFNGTSLSAKARRALENEKISMVSHISGYIHTIYDKATIEPESYKKFTSKLSSFLETELNSHIFINFLRFNSKYKSLFQYRHESAGSSKFIPLEKMFEYEHLSRYSVSDESRIHLVNEIDSEEFHISPVPGKMELNKAEAILAASKGRKIEEIELKFLEAEENIGSELTGKMFADIREFIRTVPKLPSDEKEYLDAERLSISVTGNRESITDYIIKTSAVSETARLALYIFRKMDMIDWLPFLKAAIERNPVANDELTDKTIEEAAHIVSSFSNESIYDGQRLALPDEVWNFRRGDGIEKALLLASVLMLRDNNATVTIETKGDKVYLVSGNYNYTFSTVKGFNKLITISDKTYSVSSSASI